MPPSTPVWLAFAVAEFAIAAGVTFPLWLIPLVVWARCYISEPAPRKLRVLVALAAVVGGALLLFAALQCLRTRWAALACAAGAVGLGWIVARLTNSRDLPEWRGGSAAFWAWSVGTVFLLMLGARVCAGTITPPRFAPRDCVDGLLLANCLLAASLAPPPRAWMAWLTVGAAAAYVLLRVHHGFWYHVIRLQGEPSEVLATWAFALPTFAVTFAGVAGAVTSIARWAIAQPVPLACCQCGYSLHGLPEDRCPECGTLIHPEQLIALRSDSEARSASSEPGVSR